MKADSYNLEEIFSSTRQYCIPIFQRPYVWQKEEQWIPFWEDITNVANRLVEKSDAELRPHFLGAIVLQQWKTKTNEIEKREVIDGQQRITTIQIFLNAVYDYLRNMENIDKKYISFLNKFVRNDDTFDSDKFAIFKVRPSKVDEEELKNILDTTCPAELKKCYGLSNEVDEIEKLIPDAYLYFWNEIDIWLHEDEKLDDRLNALRNTVSKGIKFVVIDLEEDDDPQIIFETLNARGTPLLQSDLVKNLLFYKADKEKLDVAQLYKKYWQIFDDNTSFWRKEVKQGRWYRTMIDIFLQYYLSLVESKDIISSSLFAGFKNYEQSNPEITPESHLQNLNKYAGIYESLFKYKMPSRIGEFFYRLDVLETTTVYPLLLEVFSKIDPIAQKKEIEQVLILLESFLIRRQVCRFTTKNYNKLFLNINSKLNKAGDYSSERLAACLLESTAETDKWPTDAEFKEAWMTSKLYFSMSRARARMILEAINERLIDEKSEPVITPKKLTIEHIMPQSWKEHWAIEDSSIEAETRRDTIIHTIGNLTLLTKKLNPSVSNGPWDEKKDALRKHSVINLNRELVNKYNEVWDEGTIKKRGENLFNTALEIWPRPKSKGTGT